MLRLAFLLFAVAFCAPATRGQTVAKLEDSESYQKGLDALADRLPDLAIRPFEAALEEFKDQPAVQNTLRLKLGESLVRAARVESKPEVIETRAKAALAHLTVDSLKDHEEGIFWAGQAHLLLADLESATALFARLSKAKNAELRNRALLTRAHLLSALGNPGEAATLLSEFTKTADKDLAEEARLLHATILLAEGKLDEFEALLPEGVTLENQRRSNHLHYLRAQLYQASAQRHQERAEKELALEAFENALNAFRELVGKAEQLNPLIHHSAQVSLAECLHATGKTEDGIETLINLVEQHPRTVLLEASFRRLLAWASTETFKNRIEQQLLLWASAAARTPEEGPKESTTSEVIISPATKERTGYALYYHALLLAAKNDAQSNKAAETRLRLLQSKLPEHSLISASQLEIAKLQIADRRKEEAIATLNQLEASTLSPHLRAEAGRLAGRLKFEEGDFKTAGEAFLRVRESITAPDQDIVSLNAGISLLRAGDEGSFKALIQSLGPSAARGMLKLEQALYQAARGIGDARPALETFLRENRNHRRVPEARLAIAEECLRLQPASQAAVQQVLGELNSLRGKPLSQKLALRRLNVHLRLAGISGDWKPAIAASKQFLRNHPASHLSPTVGLKLAEAYYYNGNLGDAQARFQGIANSVPDPAIKEIALFYAARSALKLGAKNSLEEATRLLQSVIAGRGVLANDARLLLAHSQIDEHAPEALKTLLPLLEADGPKPIDALMLAADAHRSIGQTSNFQTALKIYDQVLARPNLPYPLNNRLHSLKGQVYESLGDPGSALDTYYHVVKHDNIAEGQEPTEWFYFTQCADKAIRILERGAHPRWDAIVEMLRIVEQSGSPKREYAGRRRAELQLKYQLRDNE